MGSRLILLRIMKMFHRMLQCNNYHVIKCNNSLFSLVKNIAVKRLQEFFWINWNYKATKSLQWLESVKLVFGHCTSHLNSNKSLLNNAAHSKRYLFVKVDWKIIFDYFWYNTYFSIFLEISLVFKCYLGSLKSIFYQSSYKIPFLKKP